MARWWAGVAGWSVPACPLLVASGAYATTAGLSDDGTILYTLTTSTLELLGFPSLAAGSSVDLDSAMDALGAGGGGNIQVGTLADDGYLYAAAYVTSSTNIQLFKVLLDGTSPTLLWTAAAATSSADSYSIGWHPAEPDYIFLLYGTDAGGSRFSKIHRTTGIETVIDTYADDYLANRDSLQQYDDGFVFFVGTAGISTTGTIYVYDIGADAFDSIPATSSFGGSGTSPAGLTYWTEDSIGNGGDGDVHAFTIAAGPVITETSVACSDPWGGSEVIYYIATTDRSQVYVGDGLAVWAWP